MESKRKRESVCVLAGALVRASLRLFFLSFCPIATLTRAQAGGRRCCCKPVTTLLVG